MIPRLDAGSLENLEDDALERLKWAAHELGFLVVTGTQMNAHDVTEVIESYRRFFSQGDAQKQVVSMVRTGSNRGWGPSKSEQVNPKANPDYKEVFDCGLELPAHDPMAELSVYAANRWPDQPVDFAPKVQSYFKKSLSIGMIVLRAIAAATGRDAAYFDDKFSKPMALLRGNYYPPRPASAGALDFGIAAHSDYGCLTLLATDGQPGLEIQLPDGSWQSLTVSPGEFVINFGEMLEMWTDGDIKATMHRVRGNNNERISIPMFLNPNYDTNVAPAGQDQILLAGEHLSRRYNETYVHLQSK